MHMYMKWTDINSALEVYINSTWEVGGGGGIFLLTRIVTDINRRAKDTEKSLFNFSPPPCPEKEFKILSNIGWIIVIIAGGWGKSKPKTFGRHNS